MTEFAADGWNWVFAKAKRGRREQPSAQPVPGSAEHRELQRATRDRQHAIASPVQQHERDRRDRAEGRQQHRTSWSAVRNQHSEVMSVGRRPAVQFGFGA